MPIQFDFRGKTYFGEMERIGSDTWYYIDGETWCEPITEGRSKNRKVQGKVQTGKVSSPMPGKITKILTKVGDAVSVGQTLLMMEAMKMEYTLKAEVAGVIKSLGAAEGDQVTLGQMLVDIDEAKDGK